VLTVGDAERAEDLNFFESSIKCSQEAIIVSVTEVLQQLSVLAHDLDSELSRPLAEQICAMEGVKEQLLELCNKTEYLQAYAQTKTNELDSAKISLAQQQVDIENLQAKSSLLMVGGDLGVVDGR